jgi:oligopeptide transport system ATP-binding protein
VPPLLSVNDLTIRFHTRRGIVHAVERVSFDLRAGETLGLVGESGCGKSVTCLSLLGLIPSPPGRTEGRILLAGSDLTTSSPRELRAVRGRRISMIFQDPMTSLNPYLRIGTQIAEPLRLHEGLSRNAALARAIEALEHVGIADAPQRIHDYPHQFSGGMRQRAMIAMALVTRPEILVADEPTTALDVTVQAQILDLMRRLQHEYGTAVLFITHDLGVVAEFCSRIAVMYAGQIVETGPTAAVFARPRHPYTAALRMALPGLEPGTRLRAIAGEPPQLTAPPTGCSFAPRCPRAQAQCDGPCTLHAIADHRATACIREVPDSTTG